MSIAVANGCASRTVNHLRSVLRSALSDAERARLISSNVAKLARPRRVESSHVEPMTPEEAKLILQAVAGSPIDAIVATALWTGLRQGEVLGLRWRDVSRDFSELSVRGALHRHAGIWSWTPPKTSQSVRTVAIPGPLVPVLRDARARLEAVPLPRESADGLPADLVFTDNDGTPVEGTGVTHRFSAALARAGLPRRRFHDLRHGTATLLLASGVDIKVVSAILGHSTIAVTANLYAQVLPQLHRDAAARMADLLR